VHFVSINIWIDCSLSEKKSILKVRILKTGNWCQIKSYNVSIENIAIIARYNDRLMKNYQSDKAVGWLLNGNVKAEEIDDEMMQKDIKQTGLGVNSI
jgi:hypothetical protein